MERFMKDIKTAVESTIRDLFSNKDKYHRIDVDVVAEIIERFVLEHENFETINNTNEYEARYIILGKAAAIAQGWKINYADQVALPSQTRENLEKYMVETYGSAAKGISK